MREQTEAVEPLLFALFDSEGKAGLYKATGVA
jgi:hypothetical protein